MKKKILFIFLLLFLFIPFNVKAADIKSTSVVGMSSVTSGEDITLTYYINFTGIDKNSRDSLGLYMVVFEVLYDESVLEIKSVSSPAFETVSYKDKNITYIMSVLKNEIPSKYRCIDGVLFCSSYSVSVTYKAINDKVTSTTVGMGDVNVVFASMTGGDKEIYEDTLLESSASSEATKTIKINKKEENKNSTTSNKTESSNKNNNSTTKTKSSNKYLKSLKIENYEIDFNKNTNNYEINIYEDVNKLKIEAETEDSKATYKITGAEDLKKYNYKVFVVVTAENGDTNTYTINTKVDEIKESVDVIEEEKEESPKVEFEITKEHIKIGGIILGVIILLLIITYLIRHFGDRKIDKALDDI